MKVYFELMWFFKKEKKAYSTGILALVIVAILQLIPPRIVGMVVDEITGDTLTVTNLIYMILILISNAIALYVLRYLWRISIFGSAVRLARLMRRNLFEHFTNMPISFYQRKRTGDLMAHATNDIQAVQQTAGFGILSLFDSLAQGGAVFIAMLFIDWKLTLIALIPMPIMAILTNFYSNKLYKSFFKAQEAFSDMNDKTQESINGIKVTKSFGQENEEIDSFIEQSEDLLKKNMVVAKVDGLYDPTISFISGLCFILALGFGGYMVVNGDLTIGKLISFTTYLGLLIWPMLAFGFLFNVLERGSASYTRIKQLLAEKMEIADLPTAIDEVPSGNLKYAISSFTYPNCTDPTLESIHFELAKGETLGIVGKTGSGKSTLLKLLMREFDLEDGAVYFGNHELKDYKISNLRSALGYVPQDNFLFSTSIRENIAFANVNAPLEEVEIAAKLANIDEDIKGFSDGYDTVVGERGVALSGGQKQRIAIARALIMNPEVLMLDDSLSAVDAKTEETILRNLKDNREQKTTIITAHRLSAIKHAHKILVLENGKVIQSGTHEELVEKDGWYREMYLMQQLEELVEMGG
ncbi:MAG: ATP-binding cassette protein [Bacillales bacterium]|jgi:ATP-binding cassette subfamily B protein|nr:ATP-binding cassette protein [Bacillales bacterium]